MESPVVCNGNGVCQSAQPRNCSPYACDAAGKRCLKACTSNADCATGAECNLASSQCASTDNTCKDDTTVLSPGGVETACTPGHKCRAGACLTVCSNATDCTSGYECHPPACLPVAGADAGPPTPAASANEDSGCGCRAAGDARSHAMRWAWALFAMALAAARARSRRIA